jgi:hypothetical protein
VLTAAVIVELVNRPEKRQNDNAKNSKNKQPLLPLLTDLFRKQKSFLSRSRKTWQTRSRQGRQQKQMKIRSQPGAGAHCPQRK